MMMVSHAHFHKSPATFKLQTYCQARLSASLHNTVPIWQSLRENGSTAQNL